MWRNEVDSDIQQEREARRVKFAFCRWYRWKYDREPNCANDERDSELYDAFVNGWERSQGEE